MYFACYRTQHKTIFTGRHASYDFLFSAAGVFPPFIMAGFYHYWMLILIAFLLLHYKTSVFTIELGKDQLCFKKRVFGIRYTSFTFNFTECRYHKSIPSFEFLNNEESIRFAYEQFDYDEFGYERKNKYKCIGTLENSNALFVALREVLKEEFETNNFINNQSFKRSTTPIKHYD